MKVEPGISYEERELPGGRSWVIVAQVTVSLLQRQGYYDVGTYDADLLYGGQTKANGSRESVEAHNGAAVFRLPPPFGGVVRR